MPSSENITIQEQTLNSLSMMVINMLSTEMPRQYVRLYMYIKIIAKRLNEKEIERDLDRMYEGTEIKRNLSLPLPVLNYTYDKDCMIGYSPMKTYTIKIEDKEKGLGFPKLQVQLIPLQKKSSMKKTQITLQDIIMALDRAKIKMIDYFTQMAIEHNIEISQITPPALSSEGLPAL